jgi:alpha-galactosidase
LTSYAGALESRRRDDVDAIGAYRRALALLRDAAGPDAFVLGCGAPLLPSLGLVDAMRISPDIMPTWEPPDVPRPGTGGVLGQHGGRAAHETATYLARVDT